MFEGLQAVNWETLGAQVLSLLTVVIGIVIWLKKNITNIKQLKADDAEVSEQVKYFRAMLKDNKGLKNEIAESKIAMRDLKAEFKAMRDHKDSEINDLKQDLRLAIETIKSMKEET